MLLAQEVIDRLDRIKGHLGDLHKNGNPVRHSTVPEPRKLQCFQITPVFGLARNEYGFRVHVAFQIKCVSLPVTYAADDVHRIEVGGRAPDGLLRL